MTVTIGAGLFSRFGGAGIRGLRRVDWAGMPEKSRGGSGPWHKGILP